MSPNHVSAVFDTGFQLEFSIYQNANCTENTHYQRNDYPLIPRKSVGILGDDNTGNHTKQQASEKTFNGFFGRNFFIEFMLAETFPEYISKSIICPYQYKNSQNHIRLIVIADKRILRYGDEW